MLDEQRFQKKKHFEIKVSSFMVCHTVLKINDGSELVDFFKLAIREVFA